MDIIKYKIKNLNLLENKQEPINLEDYYKKKYYKYKIKYFELKNMSGSGKGAIFAKLFSKMGRTKMGRTKMMTHFTKFKRQRQHEHHERHHHEQQQHHHEQQDKQYQISENKDYEQYEQFQQFLTHHENINKVAGYTLENIPHKGIFHEQFLEDFLTHIKDECKTNPSTEECIDITKFFNEECHQSHDIKDCNQLHELIK
jgi:hypothetical protein